MAYVRFMAPLSNIGGKEALFIDAGDVRELCRELINRFGTDMERLLDENGELSGKLILLVNRRNALILQGADTALDKETEVIVMQFFGGG